MLGKKLLWGDFMVGVEPCSIESVPVKRDGFIGVSEKWL